MGSSKIDGAFDAQAQGAVTIETQAAMSTRRRAMAGW